MKEPDFMTGTSDGLPTEEDFKTAFNAMKEAVTETSGSLYDFLAVGKLCNYYKSNREQGKGIKQRCTVCGNGDTTLRNQSYLLHGEIVSGRICTDCYKKYAPTPIMAID